MTNRRKPAQRSTGSTWKPTRPKAEIAKAVGAGSAVVLLTVLAIFLMKPDDTSASTPAPVPPISTPVDSGGTTPTLPTSSVPTTPSTPTTPTQP